MLASGHQKSDFFQCISIITSAKEIVFLPEFVCLSVCLCVSKITQNVMERSF